MRLRSAWTVLAIGVAAATTPRASAAEELPGVYFMPAGESPAQQDPRAPAEVGLAPDVIAKLQAAIGSGRWALWRHGYLVHVEGDFNDNEQVSSLRKTAHALTTGALLQQGRLASIDQAVGSWNLELTGCDADATWRQLMLQTTTFDEPGLCPGDLWAYSDANPFELNRAQARVWFNDSGADFDTNFDQVIGGAWLDATGAQGWHWFASGDGVRLEFDLEDLGRIGLLLATAGVWDGQRLVPASFVRAMSLKGTAGIEANFANLNDGFTELCHIDDCPLDGFSESPYGFLSWVNTDRDLWPNARSEWAVGLGGGGNYLAWAQGTGVVLAILASANDFAPVPGDNRPGWPMPIRSVIETLDAAIESQDPLVSQCLAINGGGAAQARTGGPLFGALCTDDATGLANPVYRDITVPFHRGARDRVFVASDPRTFGALIVDDVLKINGTDTGLGPYDDQPGTPPYTLNVPIEQNLVPEPSLDVTSLIPVGSSDVAIELNDLQGPIYGNSELYLALDCQLYLDRPGITTIDFVSQEKTVADRQPRFEIRYGLLSELRADADFDRADCLDKFNSTPATDPLPDPPAGDGFYYIGRGLNTCTGEEYQDSSLDPDPRDLLDGAQNCH